VSIVLRLQRKNTKHTSRPKRKVNALPPAIESYVFQGLKQNLSPEQIVISAKREDRAYVCHERIYQYTWTDKYAGSTLYTHLHSQGKRYRKRGASKDKRGQKEVAKHPHPMVQK